MTGSCSEFEGSEKLTSSKRNPHALIPTQNWITAEVAPIIECIAVDGGFLRYGF